VVLQEFQKMRVRTHMRVPVLGVQDSGFALGYRFPNVMGLLERRMNTLQPNEFAAITGTPTGAVSLLGSVALGNTLTVTINGNPQTYTVTSGDMSAPDPVFSMANNAANQITAANLGAIATAQPTVTWPATQIGQTPQLWQLAFVSQSQATFTISVSSTGLIVPYVALAGVLPKPNQTFGDGTQAYGYIGICDYLESATALTSDLIKFSKADVVEFRGNELQLRADLYDYWCEHLAEFLGIPLAPYPPAGNFGGANTGLIV